jgi:ankyrin repeat protein
MKAIEGGATKEQTDHMSQLSADAVGRIASFLTLNEMMTGLTLLNKHFCKLLETNACWAEKLKLNYPGEYHLILSQGKTLSISQFYHTFYYSYKDDPHRKVKSIWKLVNALKEKGAYISEEDLSLHEIIPHEFLRINNFLEWSQLKTPSHGYDTNRTRHYRKQIMRMFRWVANRKNTELSKRYFSILSKKFDSSQDLNNLFVLASILNQKDYIIRTINQFGSNLELLTLAYFLACSLGNTDVLKLILQCNKIDINHKDINKSTALMAASTYGHTDVVNELLKQKNIDVHSQTEGRETAFTQAGRCGYSEIIRALLQCKEISINKEEYSYALIEAIKYGYNLVAQELLKHNVVDISLLTDDRGFTLLMLAAEHGLLEIYQKLFFHGKIDIHHRSNSKSTRFYSALDDDCETTAFLIAAICGQIEMVQELLKREDLDINQSNEYGNTALMYAARRGHVKIVQILLKQEGININQHNQCGETALVLAADSDCTATFQNC